MSLNTLTGEDRRITGTYLWSKILASWVLEHVTNLRRYAATSNAFRGNGSPNMLAESCDGLVKVLLVSVAWLASSIEESDKLGTIRSGGQ